MHFRSVRVRILKHPPKKSWGGSVDVTVSGIIICKAVAYSMAFYAVYLGLAQTAGTKLVETKTKLKGDKVLLLMVGLTSAVTLKM